MSLGRLIWLSVVLLSLTTSVLKADTLLSDWQLNLGCSTLGPTGLSFSFTGKRSSGLTIQSGTCQRTSTNLTQLNITSATGGSLWKNRFYAVQTGEILITPPIQTTEVQPVFSVNPACPNADRTMNWIYVQWNDGAVTLQNTYLLGTADINTNGEVRVTTQYDVGGGLLSSNALIMPTTKCLDGISEATGSANLGGRLYWTANDGGVFKTNPGKATFFLPSQNLTFANLAGPAYSGITFDSSSSTLGIFQDAQGDIRNVRGSISADGKTVVIEPYNDPEAGTIDTDSTGYVDTIVFSSINLPKQGMLKGTVTRTGPAAACSNPPCQGKIACIARTKGGSGSRIFCSGQSPLDNSIPYNISLFRPHACPDGYVLVPKNDEVGASDDFCVAKYEMKNVGGSAVSEKAGTPWVSIDRPSAVQACQAIGVGYDLITNPEWQTIARNIENNFESGAYVNWSNGSKWGGNRLNRGHSDVYPPMALAAGDDQDPCAGTGNFQCANPAHPDFSQKRTHKLMGGKVIWDFAGNVSEWVKNNMPTAQGSNGYITQETFLAGTKNRWGPTEDYRPTGTFPKTDLPFGDLGYGYFSPSASTVVRGGSWSDPLAAGIFSANLSVPSSFTSDKLGFRCVFHTTASPNAAWIGFTPCLWDAGEIVLGTAKTSPLLSLTNEGWAPATLAEPALEIIGSGWSIVQHNCTGSLLPGASCQAQVAFNPTAAGKVSGSLNVRWVTTGLTSYQAARLRLKGSAVSSPAALSLSATSYAAGNVAVGAFVTSSLFTLSNTGGATATLAAPPFTLTGAGLTVESNTCPSSGGTLAAGQTCQFAIRFSPTVSGAVSGSLAWSWTSAGASGAQSTSLSVSGMGVGAPSLTMQGATNQFANRPNTVSTAPITLVNSGDGEAILPADAGISVTGPGFSLESNTCGWVSAVTNGSVPAHGSCQFTVKFTSSYPWYAGQRSYGTPTVKWSDSTLSVIQVLSSPDGLTAFADSSYSPIYITGVNAGNGTNDLGTVAIGSSAEGFVNIWVAANTMTYLPPGIGMGVIGRDWSFSHASCWNPLWGGLLSPGATCSVFLKFAPTVRGRSTATPTFVSQPASGSSSPLVTTTTTVADVLIGTGALPPNLVWTPQTDPYGTLPKCTGKSVSWTLTNTGDLPAWLSSPTSDNIDFSASFGSCSSTLAAGASCQVTVAFNPGAPYGTNCGNGTFNGAITIAYGQQAPWISPLTLQSVLNVQAKSGEGNLASATPIYWFTKTSWPADDSYTKSPLNNINNQGVVFSTFSDPASCPEGAATPVYRCFSYTRYQSYVSTWSDCGEDGLTTNAGFGPGTLMEELGYLCNSPGPGLQRLYRYTSAYTNEMRVLNYVTWYPWVDRPFYDSNYQPQTLYAP